MKKEISTGDKRQSRKQKQKTFKRIHSLKNPKSGERFSVTKTAETSLELAENLSIVQEMAKAYIETIEYYKADHSGAMAHNEAIEQAASMNEFRRQRAETLQPEEINWAHIAAIAEVCMKDALQCWARVREAADNELISGRRAAKVAGDNTNPYALAQFLAIRDSFADQWQPNGAIEAAMIDMLTIAFSLQMYWAGIAHQRAIRTFDRQKSEVEKFESFGWKSPYQSEADAVDQAHRLADGYNRQFLRVLRQLRDLRRYAPVVIQNNGGQVNVGAQQVNIQKTE
jgi:hypothetical protein